MSEVQQQVQTKQTIKRKKKASTNAIREIKNEQKSTKNIIPVAPFQRLVQEITKDHGGDLRIKNEAYQALQTASEDFLVDVFRRSNKCAIHENRETIQPKDLSLATSLSQNSSY